MFLLDRRGHSHKDFNISQPAAKPPLFHLLRLIVAPAVPCILRVLRRPSTPCPMNAAFSVPWDLHHASPRDCCTAWGRGERSLGLSSKMSPVAAVRRCTTQALAPPIMPRAACTPNTSSHANCHNNLDSGFPQSRLSARQPCCEGFRFVDSQRVR